MKEYNMTKKSKIAQPFKLSDLKPLHDWILVQKEFTTVSKGGIIYGGNKEERPTTGKVLQIGDKVTMVKVGDRIHFPYAAGTTMEEGTEKLSIIKEVDLNGVFEE